MAHLHDSHHSPHHLNWTACGFGILALAFLGLAIAVNQAAAASSTLTFVLVFGASLSALSAWFHQRWDPSD